MAGHQNERLYHQGHHASTDDNNGEMPQQQSGRTRRTPSSYDRRHQPAASASTRQQNSTPASSIALPPKTFPPIYNQADYDAIQQGVLDACDRADELEAMGHHALSQKWARYAKELMIHYKATKPLLEQAAAVILGNQPPPRDQQLQLQQGFENADPPPG